MVLPLVNCRLGPSFFWEAQFLRKPGDTAANMKLSSSNDTVCARYHISNMVSMSVCADDSGQDGVALHWSSSDTVVWCGNPNPLFLAPLLSVAPAAVNKRHLIQPLNAPPGAHAGSPPEIKRTNTLVLIMCGTHRRSERGRHSGRKGPGSEPAANVVAHLHLPFFLAVSNAAEERLLRSSTGGKTIPLGFALPVSSQQRQKQRKKIKGGKKIIILGMRCLGLDQSANQSPSLRLLKHSLLKFQPDCTFMEMPHHQWLHSLLSSGLLVSL